MLVSALITLLAACVYLLMNRYRKTSYVLVAYFFSISLMTVIAVLYVSKTSLYRFPFQIDFILYDWISRTRIHIKYIARLFNLSLCCFMTVPLLLGATLHKPRYFRLLLMFLPILFFMTANDPDVIQDAYLFFHLSPGLSPALFDKALSGSARLSLLIFYAYMLASFAILIHYYFTSKVIANKRHALLFLFYILLINGYVAAVFLRGPFSHVMFFNVNVAKLPTATGQVVGYIAAPILLLLIVFAILLISFWFKPFNTLVIMRKKDIAMSEKMLSNSINLLLHNYKNAFLGTRQQFQLVMDGLNSDHPGDALFDAKVGLDIANQQLETLNKTASLLKSNEHMLPEAIDVTKCINEVISSVKAPPGVKILKEFYAFDMDISVLGIPHLLKEALRNLFINAFDALSESGRSDPAVEVKAICEDSLCIIEIADNGGGIEKKDIKNIFKPFYSTKLGDFHSGLGLNYVLNVINKHNGDISVKSVPGQYTKFQIALPLCRHHANLRPKGQRSG